MLESLIYPDVRTFGELFVESQSYADPKPEWMREFRSTLLPMPAVTVHKAEKLVPTERLNISPYCSVSDPLGVHWRSMWVRPTLALWLKLHETMIKVDYDAIYFHIVIRTDGALVLAQYNQIIGSRWIALIDPATIPTY